MRCSVHAYLVLAAIVVNGCRKDVAEISSLPAPKESTETQVFLNVDVPAIKDAALKHFDDVVRHGSQAKSEHGGRGFMAMNGRKFQRFQIQGTISENGRQALYTQLKSEVKAVLDDNGATIVAEIKNTVHDRPIWYLSMIFPSGSPIDVGYLEGFYLEYTTRSGNGCVDVMANKSTKEGADDSWEIGFSIHEPHELK